MWAAELQKQVEKPQQNQDFLFIDGHTFWQVVYQIFVSLLFSWKFVCALTQTIPPCSYKNNYHKGNIPVFNQYISTCLLNDTLKNESESCQKLTRVQTLALLASNSCTLGNSRPSLDHSHWIWMCSNFYWELLRVFSCLFCTWEFFMNNFDFLKLLRVKWFMYLNFPLTGS